jgi:myo-inositol-hexaphosphate 3-phosphohydrolase
MLSLIAPAMSAARTAHSQAVADGPWSEHSFANAVFQVSTPANWEEHADPSITNAGIWLTDRQNDLHLIASATQKQDLAIPSLEALQQHVVQTLQQNAVDLRIGEKLQIRVDDRPAVDVAMAGTFNGVNLIFYSRLVEYPDTWVEVRLWTTPSRFQEHEATFGRIASTLHQKK